MKKILPLVLLFAAANAATAQEYVYRTAETPWAESFGNQRAVLQISKAGEVANLHYRWRRHDENVAARRMLIVNAQTGDTVKNVRRISVTQDACNLQFGPVAKGTYYFYYLPYPPQGGDGFFWHDYLKPETAAPETWGKTTKTVEAAVEAVESKTDNDSFYPMEIALSKDEMKEYADNHPSAFYVFAADRTQPVRMRHALPFCWKNYQQGSPLALTAQPNEYRSFQMAVWAYKAPLDSLSYEITAFTSPTATLPASAVTCFNTEGTDTKGQAFHKTVNVGTDDVQPLWFGIDLPKDAAAGTYTAKLTLKSKDGRSAVVPLTLTIGGSVLADRGDSETWRYSRLRWFNSTLGLADTPIEPYTAIKTTKQGLDCSGRTVTTDKNSPLPAQISANGQRLLASPLQFIVETADGVKQLKAKPQIVEETSGHFSTTWKAEDADLTLTCNTRSEFDGWADYKYTLCAKRDLTLKDVRLEMNFNNASTPYFMGLGLPGQDTPTAYDGRWDKQGTTELPPLASIPTNKGQSWLWPFDSFWTGSTEVGVHCELRGASYTGPLLNLYRPAPPQSWYNQGKGGFKLNRGDKATRLVAYSGERTLTANRPIDFEFALLTTPMKQLNTKAQFVNRYYHSGGRPVPTDSDVRAGVRIINIHHANELNPIINYPFVTVNKLRNFVDEWHQKGCKVKIYYTVRELTSALTEIWALRSLGHEVLSGGEGGAFPWCREHLEGDYTPQWYHHFENLGIAKGITADQALLTAEGDSRWLNYYIEGLRWCVENLHIDGIYLDDVAFGRDILKRMRRAMASIKPGCIIDLHSNTGFSRGPATQYTEYFPYVDKLWLGESFQYDKMSPANWLVEVSGIPFGLTSDMLQAGGNKWLGMQYGMTVRHPWTTEGMICDPRYVWKVWDSFDIADSKMIGFWEKTCPVESDNPLVKVTAYNHSDGRTLLSVGNYSDTPQTVHLKIDKAALHLNGNVTSMTAPAVYSFQDTKTWTLGDAITVPARKGWLIYLNNNQKEK